LNQDFHGKDSNPAICIPIDNLGTSKKTPGTLYPSGSEVKITAVVSGVYGVFIGIDLKVTWMIQPFRAVSANNRTQ